MSLTAHESCAGDPDATFPDLCILRYLDDLSISRINILKVISLSDLPSDSIRSRFLFYDPVTREAIRSRRSSHWTSLW